MMSHTDLPVSFWGYALETTVHILNRAPSKSVKTAPFEEWHGTKPKLSHLKIWGCEAYVRKLQPENLNPRKISASLWAIPRKLVDIPSTISLRAKRLLPRLDSFLGKSFSQKS